MDLEVIRAVAAWLADPTNGVNAQIASVTLDSGDPAPAAIQAVLDETTSTVIALRQIPDEQPTPFLVVWTTGDAEVKPVNQGKQDVEGFAIAVACVHRELEADQAIRDGSYLMRAARRSLNRFHDNAAEEDRRRNNIEIRNGGVTMTWIHPELKLESAIVSRGIGLTYRVRDHDP